MAWIHFRPVINKLLRRRRTASKRRWKLTVFVTNFINPSGKLNFCTSFNLSLNCITNYWRLVNLTVFLSFWWDTPTEKCSIFKEFLVQYCANKMLHLLTLGIIVNVLPGWWMILLLWSAEFEWYLINSHTPSPPAPNLKFEEKHQGFLRHAWLQDKTLSK